MRKRICLLAALLMLSGCAAPEPPAEFLPESSVPTSSVSSQPAPGMPEASSDIAAPSETEVSSEAESSAPASSEAASSEVLPPVESEPIPELVCPLAGSQVEAPTSSQEQPVSSQTEPVQLPPTSSTIPEEDRPMTDAEVDALIEEAIAYAESKGMTWYDAFSLSNDIIGYNPPGHSEWGYRACKETVFYNIDDVCNGVIESPRYQEGNGISYKIEKGRIDPFEGWFIYVLY